LETKPIPTETATVLFAYEKNQEDEISIEGGEIVLVMEKNDNQWWKIQNNDGSVGFVPGNYLQMNDPWTVQEDVSSSNPFLVDPADSKPTQSFDGPNPFFLSVAGPNASGRSSAQNNTK
jgi:uncharacterized protein YgiM (DUF1202 family)